MSRRKHPGPVLPPAEPAPEALLHSVDKARERTRARRHGPPLQYKRDADGVIIRDDGGAPIWDWPFETTPGDKPWSWMVLDAFGTRNADVATVFVNHLLMLCPDEWDSVADCWAPDERVMTAMLHVISAYKPKNEAQAMMAAERAATSLLMFKLAGHVSRAPYDHRTVGSYARLVHAGAAQSRALADMQGKRRSTVQNIKVTRENHVHYHDHRPGGAGGKGGQPHAPNDVAIEQRPALPSHGPLGDVLPFPSREGEAGLPDARGLKRIGSAKG